MSGTRAQMQTQGSMREAQGGQGWVGLPTLTHKAQQNKNTEREDDLDHGRALSLQPHHSQVARTRGQWPGLGGGYGEGIG